MKRRQFIATVALSACQRRKSLGFPGFAFVANSEGGAVAAVDLQAFAVVRHIRVKGNPTALVAHPSKPVVYALTPENGLLHRIDVSTLNLEASRSFLGSAAILRRAPAGDTMWVLSPAERKLLRVNLDRFVPETLIGLPEGVTELDLSPRTPFAAVAIRNAGQVALIDLRSRRVVYQVKIGQKAGPLRFLKNGKLLLAGSPADQSLVVLDTVRGERLVELPLSVKAERFCFDQGGGQLFITGPGADAVALVYPYQTQVAGTILAGHAPGAMAASAAPDLLFVANPQSGEVSVIDLRTQKVRAVVPVGNRPEAITITPDNNFALVMNRGSGDMAVIRADAMAGRRTKAAPLFTMIPVGSAPVAAVVIAV